jgi:nicotinamide mononucleotide transporter
LATKNAVFMRLLAFRKRLLFNYFTKGEISLWCISVTLIVVSFLLFDRENYLTLVASFIGVTSLIFNAKGNPYNGNKAEVKVNRLELKEIIFMMILIAVITLIFYHILAAFHTANLIPSTSICHNKLSCGLFDF